MAATAPEPLPVRLRRLAGGVDEFDADMASRVRNLAGSLGDPLAAAAWLGLDPIRVVAPERLAGIVPPHPVVRLLELARNAAMLVPIVVTWLGVGLAVSAYHAAVAADSTLANQSFLYLWETGFGGGNHPAPTLSQLAFADVLLVGLILLFLVATPAVERALSRAAARARELSGSLQTAVVEASLELTRVLQRDGAAATTEPAGGRTSAMIVIRAASEIALRLEQVVAGQAAISRELEGAAKDLAQAARQLTSESAALRAAAGGVASGQAQFLQDLSRERQAHAGVADGLARAGAGLERTLSQTAEGTRTMHELASHMSQLGADLPPLLDGIRRSQQEVWNEQAAAAESMHSAAAAMERIARTVQQVAMHAQLDGTPR